MRRRLETLLVPRPEGSHRRSSRSPNQALWVKDQPRTGGRHRSGQPRHSRSRRQSPERPGEAGRTQENDLGLSPEKQEGEVWADSLIQDTEDVRDITLVIPQTEDEAREHIAAIYNEKVTSNQGWMARAFNNILKESARLYSDSTRFLFELIQNADDNHYQNVVPTLDITLKQTSDRRTLRFDCNELGFSYDNLKAICSLSESSKSTTGKARKYIGEKGLGFKSVFAVSDVVHIRSGYYSFRFGNQVSEPLGMVTPIWQTFPEAEATAKTSILLELSAACPMEDLLERLRTMAPTFLLFLRQLSEINIKIVDNKAKRRITLRRQDTGLGESLGSKFITVHRNDESTTYTTFCRQVSIGAEDDRRVGCSVTELVLAFPTDSRSKHRHGKNDTQHLYAFLPVHDYKLKFIIHADFILVSSRQDLAPSPWNTEILNAIPAAFMDAMNAFITMRDELQYSWLRYVPLPKLVDKTFKDVATKTVRLLSQSPVLEDHEGNLTIPSRLTYVSSDYRDADKKPLIPPARQHSKYISDQYSPEDKDTLLALGVGEIIPEHFLNALHEFVSKSAEIFQSRPSQWHRQLSKVLVTLINKDTSSLHYKGAISTMKIIPLQSGKWTNAKDGTVIFPMPADSPAIPEGIPVFEVHRDAAQDPSRENLLILLGVERYRTRDICDAIVRSHRDSQFVANGVRVPELIAGLPLPQLLSHIQFLMTAGWSSRSATRDDLLFVAEDGSRHRGSTLYLISEEPYSASRIFRKGASEPSNQLLPGRYPINFLHGEYSSLLSNFSKNWTLWLCKNLKLATIPRLVTLHSPGSPFTIMEDFKLVVQNEPALTVLMLLREHWLHYRQCVAPEQGRKSQSGIDNKSVSQIQRYLSRLDVPCQGGGSARLGQTTLPTQDVLLALGFGSSNPPSSQLRSGPQIPTSLPHENTPGPRLRSKQRDLIHPGVDKSSRISSEIHLESTRKMDLSVERPKSGNQKVSRGDHDRDERKSRYKLGNPDRHTKEGRRTSRDKHGGKEKQKSSRKHKGRARHQSRERNETERHRSRDRHHGRQRPNRDRSRERRRTLDRRRSRDRNGSHDRDIEHLSPEREPSQYQRKPREENSVQDNQKSPDKHKPLADPSEARNDNKADHEKRAYELFLDVPNPDDEKWSFLEHFGVVVQMSADVFVDRLRQLKDTPTTKEHVAQLYEKIEKSVRELGAGNLSQAFENEPLIYWPSGSDDGTGKWVPIGDCVWEGPACLKNVPRLVLKYPKRFHLFKVVLRCKNADMSSLVEEAMFVTPKDSLRHITDLFRAIDLEGRATSLSKDKKLVSTLTALRIFPTTTTLAQPGFTLLETATADGEWYIPDQFQLAKLFEPKLRLLAFDSMATASLGSLFDALGLQNRALSSVTTESTAAEGATEPNPAYQDWLHTRLRYINGLLSPDLIRSGLPSRLQQMQVYKTERIVITWTVRRLNGSTGAQCTEEGEAFIAVRGAAQRLEMFLLHKDSEPGQAPMVLIMELSRLCHITGGEGNIILSHILSQHPTHQIERYLKRQGILFDPAREEGMVGDVVSRETGEVGPQEEVRDGTSNPRQAIDSVLNPPGYPSPSWVTSLDTEEAEEVTFPSTVSDTGEENRASTQGSLDIISNRGMRRDRSRRTKRSTSPWAGRIPSPFNEFKDMESGFLSVDLPSTRFVSKDSKTDTAYIGELYVSKFLEGVLKEDYVQNDHWLSPLRTGDGHAVYRPQEEECFPFKFVDKTGRFGQFLLERGYAAAKEPAETNIFYIGVWTFVGKSSSSFHLKYKQYEKAKELTTMGKQGSGLSEHLVIAQIGYLYGDTEMIFYVDPYGMLSLEAKSVFSASFRSDAQAIVVPASSRISSDLANDIYKQQMNGFAQIRIIELFKGEGNEPLKGALHVVPVDDPGIFWALSYCWGAPPSKFAPYYFETEEGQMLITCSLSLALRQIRKRITEKSIRVWADAVCIKQTDSYEKAGQIPLMGEIYKRATRVFAWLGPEDDQTTEAMEFLSRISPPECALDHKDSSLSLPPSLDINSTTETTRTALSHLLSSTWFTRVWIVQEIILGSSVYLVYGNAELEWSRFISAVRVCENQLRKTQRHWALRRSLYPTLALGIVRDYRHVDDRLFTLLELLELFAYTAATHEEDKLFALLGLALEHSKADFKPEYGPSPEFAIRKYAAAFINNRQAMLLLYRAGTAKSYNFCSWIPLWTGGSFPRTISDWNCAGAYAHFHAGRRVPIQAHVHASNPNVLVVDGHLVDTIISKAKIRVGIANYLDWVKMMVDFRWLLQSLGSEYPTTKEGRPTRETQQEFLFRFPIGNARKPYLEADEHASIIAQKLGKAAATGTSQLSENNNEDGAWPEDLPAQLLSIHVDQNAKYYEQKPKETRDWIEKYWQTVAVFSERLGGNALFCVTKRGFAGLVPEGTEVGDSVCVLDGGRVPFVLKKVGTGWKLVGECYVHGFMNGEALVPDPGSREMEGGFEVRKFELF